MPLYYQLVRHESPLQIGLLLVPQGRRRGARDAARGPADRQDRRPPRRPGRRSARPGRARSPTRRSAPTRRTRYSAAALFVIGLGAREHDHALDGRRLPGRLAARRCRARRARSTSSSASPARSGRPCSRSCCSERSPPTSPAGKTGSRRLGTLASGESARTAEPIAHAFATTFFVAAGLIAFGASCLRSCFRACVERRAWRRRHRSGRSADAETPTAGEGGFEMTLLATQTLYDWLLFLHVLAAMIWLGGGVMLAATAVRVVRDSDPAAVRRFTATMRATAPFVLAPATVAVLGLGIGLVVDADAWDFGAAVGAARPRPLRGRIPDRSGVAEPHRDRRDPRRRAWRRRRGTPPAAAVARGVRVDRRCCSSSPSGT